MVSNNKSNRVLWLPDLNNDKTVKNLIKDFIQLELESKKEPVYLLIMSDGGSLANTYLLHSFLTESISLPLVTVGVSNVISAANVIFATGHLRISLVNTLFNLHKVSIDPGNELMSPEDLSLTKKELDKDTIKFFKLIIEKRKHHLKPCKLKLKNLQRLIKISADGDYYFSADEALKYGLADAVADSISDVIEITSEKLPLVQAKLKK